MKRIFLITTLIAATFLAACGGSGNSVTRNNVDALGFVPYAAPLDGATSARSSVDLLSLS